MNKNTSIFSQIQSLFSRIEFEKLVKGMKNLLVRRDSDLRTS